LIARYRLRYNSWLVLGSVSEGVLHKAACPDYEQPGKKKTAWGVNSIDPCRKFSGITN
jgi:hypothetical protein